MFYEVDKYLNMIGYRIQLNENKQKEISDSYDAISKYIQNHNDLAKDVECNIYYHGSFAIGTVIKPLHGEDFDLDIIVEFDQSKHGLSAKDFYNSFLDTFRDGKYSEMFDEYRNTVRIDYQNNYHFDIMPSVPLASNSIALSVPDTKKREWVIRAPRAFVEWFKAQTRKIHGYKVSINNYSYLMESENEPLKKIPPYETTPTLIRTVQLLKRAKDIYFKNYEGEREPQSIVLTTLAAKYYDGEHSVFEALSNVVSKMKKLYDDNNNFVVKNPGYPQEEFTEKWAKYKEYYVNYKNYINFVFSKLTDLRRSNTARKTFVELFGEHPFADVFEETKYDTFWKEQPTNIIKDTSFPDEKITIKKKERGNARR